MKKIKNNHRVKRAAIAILQYLRDHPQAKDSAEGIAKWWVGEEPEIVERALRLLEGNGVIAKHKNFYQLALHGAAPEEISHNMEKTMRWLNKKS